MSESKSAVSVTEMARMVGLSRTRFYQLVKDGIFPEADQEPETSRPYYGEEKQRQCLEVRRKNQGINGKTILFYSRRRDLGQRKAPTRPTAAKVKEVAQKYADLLDGLEALGVPATVAQVEPVLKEAFPGGTEGIDLGEVIRAVFLRIHSQNPPGSVR